jgi:hypothetical protein
MFTAIYFRLNGLLVGNMNIMEKKIFLGDFH